MVLARQATERVESSGNAQVGMSRDTYMSHATVAACRGEETTREAVREGERLGRSSSPARVCYPHAVIDLVQVLRRSLFTEVTPAQSYTFCDAPGSVIASRAEAEPKRVTTVTTHAGAFLSRAFMRRHFDAAAVRRYFAFHHILAEAAAGRRCQPSRLPDAPPPRARISDCRARRAASARLMPPALE